MQFLVAPVKWTNTMAIKRLFEDGGVPARIVGAGNVDAALSQLKKNDRYHAVLIDWEEAGPMGLELACAVKERGQPVVVAFQASWGRDDIRRALQLGVDSLLLSPFSPEELVADLRAVREKGTSLSRERLIQSGGEVLLEPDPALWDDQTDDWRDRMMGLADQLTRPWAEDMSDRASHLEVSVRKMTSVGQLSPRMAKAVLDIVSQGRDRVPEIAANRQIEPRELTRVMLAVENFAKQHGGAGRIPLLMDEVLKANEAVDPEHASNKLQVLKRVARVVIRAQGAAGRRRDALNEIINKLIGAPVQILRGLKPKERYDLCVRMLLSDEEMEALEQIRYLVLKSLIKALEKGTTSEHHLVALESLLGLNNRYEGMDAKGLIRRLAILNPIPVLQEVDLLKLQNYRDILGAEPKEEAIGLARMLEQLIEVAQPMGPIDQKRLRDLAQAMRSEAAVLIGRPAWQSFLVGLTKPLDPPFDQIVARLTFLAGARTPDANRRLIEALNHLVEVGRNAMDAARFAEFCRQASAEKLSKEIIAEYASEMHAEFTPDKVERSGASEERAQIETALAAFGKLELNLDEIRNTLPPAPPFREDMTDGEVTRLRVLASVLESQSDSEQRNTIEIFLRGHRFHDHEVDALEMMLGQVPLIDWLRAEKVDTKASFRDGFDLMPEPEMEEDEDFEGFDLDEEDEDDLPEWEGGSFDGRNPTDDGGAFDFGPVRPFSSSQAPSSVADNFDLGLDDLKFELDLDGGSINTQLEGDLPEDLDDSLRSEPPSMGSSVFNPVDDSRGWKSADPSRRGGVSVFRSGTQQNEEEDDDLDSDAKLRGFDLGPPSSAGSSGRDTALLRSPDSNMSAGDGLGYGFDEVPEDESFSLEAVQRLSEAGRLKQAALLCQEAPDDLEDLPEGLNMVALHAYVGEHYQAAARLWERGLKLQPDQVHLLFNMARLKVKIGRLAEAKPFVHRLLQLAPHLTPGRELYDQIQSELDA